MLVVTRREQETVIITTADGTQIRIIVADIYGGKVRLAFDAPQSVTIDRLEVHESKMSGGKL